MLTQIKIKNLALVESLTWDLGTGLIAITGQTGAGKSMIVGALKLILGERANHDLIRRGKPSCSVEGVFEIGTSLDAVNALLESCGLDPCEGNQLVVRRVVGSSGNKQSVNCSPCTLQVLKQLGSLLIDLHGPHEHQSLLSRERQLAMLDAYAHAENELSLYRQAWRQFQQADQALEAFQNQELANDQEIELLRYQVDEIAAAEINAEEYAEFEKRYLKAQNASRLVEHATDASASIQSANASLANARRHLLDLEKMDTSTDRLTTEFETSVLELEELEINLRDYLTELELDPAELVELENRMDQIETLKRKYG
ncbi:MAG: AAA family ATPase, partial [Verrucomicrobiota bacterium]